MIPPDLLPIVIIVIISFALGIIFGLLLAALRHSEYPEPPKEVLQKKLKQLLRLWGNDQDELVLIEAGGDVFHHIGDKTEQQRQIIANLITTLSAEVPAQIIEPSIVSPEDPSGIVALEEKANPQSSKIIKPEISNGENITSLPKRSFIDLLARANQPARVVSVEPKSIAAQVDEILQNRIQGTELEQRAIRLMELPGKGMVVMIGLDQYDSVNDVPDLEIQKVLRAAVNEWEEKMLTSGL
ncbi:MAG: hypothetical protein ACPL3P_02885 [Anaerolineales bacterium]